MPSYEVAATSRNYSDEVSPNMSVKGGSFGQDKRGGLKPPLTADRSSQRSRGKNLGGSSPIALQGVSRTIVPTFEGSLY